MEILYISELDHSIKTSEPHEYETVFFGRTSDFFIELHLTASQSKCGTSQPATQQLIVKTKTTMDNGADREMRCPRCVRVSTYY